MASHYNTQKKYSSIFFLILFCQNLTVFAQKTLAQLKKI